MPAHLRLVPPDDGEQVDPAGRLAGTFLVAIDHVREQYPELSREDVIRAAGAIVRGTDPSHEEWATLFFAVMEPGPEEDRFPIHLPDRPAS
jgi:hypothetical protein